MVRVLQQRYGLTGREDANDEKTEIEKTEAEQVGFAW